VVGGYLDTLADDPEAPEHWQRPLKQMQLQALRMNKIVEELLELSQLELSGHADEDEFVNVAGLLAAAKKSYQDRSDVASIEVQIDAHAQLLGSVSEVESVVANLLANAVRHTPPAGQITLSWTSNAEGAVLAVTDTGEGIDEQNIPRLTERFFRVDSGRSREGGGIGLGLAIVKHALGRHDAELKISSVLGEGSRFACHFPANRIASEPPVPIGNTLVKKMQ
jgi:two-component system phosphate regulon sensor histidine kinase PhoR